MCEADDRDTGAVGVEFAAEIKTNHPQRVSLIHSRNALLSNEPLPDEFKERTLKVLQEEGVDVILGERPTVHVDNDIFKIDFGEGKETGAAAFVINATTSSAPSTQFLSSDLLDKDGYVKVTGQ